jgi:hypothetical protein
MASGREKEIMANHRNLHRGVREIYFMGEGRRERTESDGRMSKGAIFY